MKYLATILALLMPASFLWAQHGGAGRDGGSRTTQDERRSEALQQNDDPRFTPFRSVIAKKLGKTVRQMVADYDQTAKKGIRMAPDQFVAVHLAAKETNLDPTVLAANTWHPPASHGMLAAPVPSTPSTEEFKEQLAKSLMRLANISKEDAEQKAGKSLNAVSSTNAEKK